MMPHLKHEEVNLLDIFIVYLRYFEQSFCGILNTDTFTSANSIFLYSQNKHIFAECKSNHLLSKLDSFVGKMKHLLILVAPFT